MAANFVRDNIGKQRVVIFSKSYCPFCTKAKDQFRKLNFEFLAIEIENRPDCDEIQDALKSITNIRTVPQVFIDGKCIGGGNDTEKLYQSGELAKMLQ